MSEAPYYVRAKFVGAVLSLATSPKSLQERINQAWTYELQYVEIEKLDDWDLRKRIEKINNDGARALQLDDDEAIELAREITDVAFLVHHR